jgi:hypothetical protein
MKFAIDFFCTRTGEHRWIITEITHKQRWHAIVHCPEPMPNPMAKLHALDNATRISPPGFVAMLGEVHLVH